jgi:serine/threonine-protein kinase
LRAELLLMSRSADSLLQMPEVARGHTFTARDRRWPGALYAAWAYQLRAEPAAARGAFASALARSDSLLRFHADEWPVHVARGFALAGLGRRDEARREARWLQETIIYRTDAIDGSDLAVDRAQILAAAGENDAALDEIERLLSAPSQLSGPLLRLDPRWDAIRDVPRFQALLAKSGGAPTK